MSIEKFLESCMSQFDDGVIKLDAIYASSDDVMKGEVYQLPETSCRISFTISQKGSFPIGIVYVESIFCEKYINLWINLYNKGIGFPNDKKYKYDTDVIQRIIKIIETNIGTKCINIPTNPKDEEYHKILEDIGYIHQVDYIYPDVKLYSKEMN